MALASSSSSMILAGPETSLAAKCNGVRPRVGFDTKRSSTDSHVISLHSSPLKPLESQCHRLHMDCPSSNVEVARNNTLHLFLCIRSKGSGHFGPWHQQMRDFAGPAGRAFRRPCRQHCGALSGLGEERSCKLHLPKVASAHCGTCKGTIKMWHNITN